MKHSLSVIGCVAFAGMLGQPVTAWTHGGAPAAGGGHRAVGAHGHAASGAYGTTGNATHGAATRGGGATEAGHTNSGSYGTTAYDGHVVAIGNGQYAYGTHVSGGAAYGGTYRPPTVVTRYYGIGCYNCGGWDGVALRPTAVAVTYANANVAALMLASPAYGAGDVSAALPAGYAYRPIGGNAYYFRDGIWFSPHYGANGTDYRVVPAP